MGISDINPLTTRPHKVGLSRNAQLTSEPLLKVKLLAYLL